MKNTTTAAKKTCKFRTPHEIARQKKAKTKPAGRDAFGGRLGSRMSKINLVVITAGKKGATVPQVAERARESAALVSAQLGWMFSHAKVCTRKQVKADSGKTTFRYFAKVS